MNRVILGLLGARGAGKDTAAEILEQARGFVRISFAAPLYEEVAAAYGLTVAQLQDRQTKETPIAALALQNCGNPEFLEVAFQRLGLTARQRRTALSLVEGRSSRARSSTLSVMLSEPRSPRWTLQTWGTEFRRKSRFGYVSYWTDRMGQFLAKSTAQRVVITDCRFVDEIEVVTAGGGEVLRVRRPALENADAARPSELLQHDSETLLANFPVRKELTNAESDVTVLRDQVLQAVDELLLGA